ncbi:MAG: acyltransferase family protein [Nitrospirota bacterium]
MKKNIPVTKVSGFLGRFFTKSLLESNSDVAYAPVRSRVEWIDNAKAIGIVLVYYGHFLQSFNSFFLTKKDLLFLQFRFIYSFHMPLFLILSGYITAGKIINMNNFLIPRIYSRLVQLIFLNLLIMPCYYLFAQQYFWLVIINEFITKLILGLPNINYPTWFLVFILIVEIYYFLGVNLIIKSNSSIILILSIIIFGLIGFFLSNRVFIEKNVYFVSKILVPR